MIGVYNNTAYKIVNNNLNAGLFQEQKTKVEGSNNLTNKSVNVSVQSDLLGLDSDASILQFLRGENLAQDDRNLGIARSLLNSNMPLNKENIEKLTDLRAKIDFVANGLNSEKVGQLFSKGLNTFDLDYLYANLKNLKESCANNNGLVNLTKTNVTSAKLGDELRHIYRNITASNKEQKVVKGLLSFGVAVTTQNISKTIKTDEKMDMLKLLNPDAIATVIGSKTACTVDNLLKANGYVESGYYENQKLTDTDLKGMEPEIKKILQDNGMEVNEQNIQAVKTLIKNNVEVTKENITKFNDLTDAIKNISEKSDENTSAGLVATEVEVGNEDMLDLNEKVNFIKDMDNDKQAIDIKNDLEIKNSGEKAINAYKLNDTLNLYKDINLKDLKEMGQNIKEFLENIKVEANDKNMEICRALIKNNIPVNAQNMRLFDEVMTDLLKNNISVDVGEKVAFEGKSVNMLSPDKIFEVLNKSKEAVENVSADPEKIQNEIDKTISKLENVRFKSFSAIGALIKNNMEITIDNLDTVVNKIDSKLTDINEININIPRAIPESQKDFVNTIIKQRLEILKIPQEEQNIEISKALIENELPVEPVNITKIANVEKSLSNIINISNDEVFANTCKKLMERGVAPAMYPIEKLEKAILQQKIFSKLDKFVDLSQNNVVQPENIENFENVLIPLRTIKNSQLSMFLKADLPQDIKYISSLKLLTENRFSPAEGLKEINNLLKNKVNMDESKKEIIKNFEEAAKKVVPKTNLNDVKSEEDVIKANKEILNKASELISKLGHSNDPLVNKISKVIEQMKDNVEVQKNINKDQFLMQVPILINDKYANLNFHIFNNTKGNKKEIDPEDMTVALNLETESLGVIDINLQVKGKSVVIGVNIENLKNKKYIEKHSEKLSERIESVGLNVSKLEFNTLSDRKSTQENTIAKKITSNDTMKNTSKTGGFEARI